MTLSHLRSTFYRWLPRYCVRHFGSSAESSPCTYAAELATVASCRVPGITYDQSQTPFRPSVSKFNVAKQLRPLPPLAGRPALLSSTNSQSPEPSPEPEDGGQISDQEWEIRTGRAIYILQQTLPDFFSTGLVSSLDTPVLPRADGLKIPADEQSESIYSPRIRLEYRPPVAFPKVLRVEGLHLYIASSVFVRHTLNAFYSDLQVLIRRVRVHGPRAQNSSGVSTSPRSEDTTPGGLPSSSSKRPRSVREKNFFIGLTVSGTGRVSGAHAQWEVNCTYTFSPTTGLICLHTVDSIEPAPHESLFDALGRFGLVGGGPGDGLKGTGAR